MIPTFLTFSILAIFSGYCDSVALENNSYRGIVIAIDSSVPENDELIQSLKDAFTEASQSLFIATEKRSYFGEITILVPSSWNSSFYNASDGECYGQADIRIAQPNPIYGDLPYTSHHGGCGEGGDYIHITPQYLTNNSLLFNTGPRGKTIVHEWAHYRWGVFDETSSEIPFTLSSVSSGTLTPTACPAAIFEGSFGVFYNISSGNQCSLSNLNLTTFLNECVYLPPANASSEVNVSMMSFHYLDQVVTFCRNGSENGANQHNIDAPNTQNRLCNLKSTWSVITESTDFGNGRNPSNTSILDTTPAFRIVRKSDVPVRFVLVLDVSGSMMGDKLRRMVEAATYFIRTSIPEGSAIGLVEFSSGAVVLHDMQVVTTAGDRETMIATLPKSAGGLTSIGGGIDTGLQVLKDFGRISTRGHLIVFTDGIQTTGLGIEDVYEKVVSEKVVVNAMFLETFDNEILIQLTNETGGFWYFISSNNQEQLVVDFNSVSSSNNCEEMDENYQIQTASPVVNAVMPHNSSVSIDSSIGRSTVFTFISSAAATGALRISLNGPNCSYANFENHSLPLCENNPIHNTSAGSIRFEIPGIAEPGLWSYSIESDSPVNDTVTVAVSSKAANNGIEPIRIVTKIIGSGDGLDGPATIRVQVSQGYIPVQGVRVTATIDRPGADSVHIELRDNGAGSDIRANDGMYSSYFTQFSSQGRYSAVARVEGDAVEGTHAAPNSATYNNGVVSEDGTVVLNPNGLRSASAGSVSSQGISLGRFTRVASAGGFSYSGRASTTTDIFPPNRVTDLAAAQNDLADIQKGVLITFTAPGDDYDQGTAFEYELRYTFGSPVSLIDDYEFQSQVTEAHILKGSLQSPLASGSRETIVIQVPLLPPSNSPVRIAFALRAFDEAGNSSMPSNVAVLTIFVKPPELEEIPTEKSTTSTPTGIRTDAVTDDEYKTTLYLILMIFFASCSLLLVILVIYLFISLRKRSREKQRPYEVSENPYAEISMESVRAKHIPFPE